MWNEFMENYDMIIDEADAVRIREINAIKILKNWKDYNIKHKEKVQRADEIIDVQETILNLIERLKKESKRYQNMYQSEHAIHMVRNEQLARKEKAVLKAQELENKITSIFAVCTDVNKGCLDCTAGIEEIIKILER